MQANITQPNARNGVNHGDTKELVSTLNVIGLSNGKAREILAIRWYMGKSSTASRVYCSVWVNGSELYISGSGKAGGYGYCKRSAAFADAVNSAGITLSENVGGVGMGAVERASEAIARGLGFDAGNLLFVRN